MKYIIGHARDRDSAWLENESETSQRECWPYKKYGCISELDQALYISNLREPEVRGSKPRGPTFSFLF